MQSTLKTSSKSKYTLWLVGSVQTDIYGTSAAAVLILFPNV